MKKVTMAAAAVLGVVALSSFVGTPKKKASSSKPKTDVSILGTLPNEDYDGDSVVLTKLTEDGRDTVATAVVKGKAFRFAKAFAPDTASLYNLRLKRKFAANVVLQAGTVQVDFSNGTAKGTALNDKLSAFQAEYSAFSNPIVERYRATKDEKEQATILEEYSKGTLSRYEALYKANLNNVLGVLALNTLIGGEVEVSPEQVDAWRAMAGEAVLTNPAIVRTFKLMDAARATSAGAKFVEVVGVNDKKEPSKLSDFVGRGHYALVDFWASWCGPCRRAMPTLKKLNETYGPKGLQIVGIAVWDEWDDHLKAVEKDALPWPQIFNKDEATAAYGVSGIPQIMLIAPDGTIVARDLHGEEQLTSILEQELAKNGGKL